MLLRVMAPLVLPLRHDRTASLALDPVRFPRRYEDPKDREAAAFLSALLAFGNVKAIGASVEALLLALGPRPARGAALVARGARRLPRSLRHRWLDAAALEGIVAALGRAQRAHGSLEALFARGFEAARDEDVGPALERFAEALGCDELPRPSGGSACKRPCLFLRWVARPDDGVDLGLWRAVPTRALVAPVDVHVARVARRLGITRRRAADWTMAREVTAALRRLDAEDPLRFDFDLVHADREAGPGAGRARRGGAETGRAVARRGARGGIR